MDSHSHLTHRWVAGRAESCRCSQAMTALASTVEIGDNLLTFLLVVVPTIPAVIAAVVTVRRTKELKPNGGTPPGTEHLSLHDKVDKVYRTVSAHDRSDDAEPHVTIDKKG